MSKSHIYPVVITKFGETVINLTEHLSTEQTFWSQSEKHLLSVVQLYITSEYDMTNFYQIVNASYELLQNSGGWLALRSTLLSVSNSELRDLFYKDALFQSDPDWLRQEVLRNDSIITVCLQRLKYLIEIYNLTQNKLDPIGNHFKSESPPHLEKNA